MRQLRILGLFIALTLTGCSTIAKKYTKEDKDGILIEYLEIKGMGKAQFSEHSTIEGKPVVEMPQLPPVKYEP